MVSIKDSSIPAEQSPLAVPSVDAIYKTDELLPEYIGNPLIEALPGILPHTEVIKSLRTEPRFDCSERNFSKETRLHCISRIFWQFFQPMEQHIRIWDYLSVCIRQGYIRRNPLSATSAEIANELYAAAMERRKPKYDAGYIPNSVGFAIIGVSGVGKSTSVAAILKMYPQVITHRSYKNRRLDRKQIVWLKIDCSHKGSERGLCLSFLAHIDRLAGTNYYNAYEKRATVDTLLTTMMRVAEAYSLGILFVDELQHLVSGKETGKLLNFFVTLENTIGVPVVLMGTPGALPLLQSDFRSARRCCAHGDIFWNPLQWDKSVRNSEWEMFLRRMWRYQWIRKPPEISPEFISSMYEETQGIEALAVILFILLQEEAMRNETETFAANDVRQTAQKNMKIVQPMLNALRSGDARKIARYSDIISVFVEEFRTQHAAGHEAGISEEKARKSAPFSSQAKIVSDYMTEMGIPPEDAEKYAVRALKANPDMKPLAVLRKAVHMYDKDKDNGNCQNEKNPAEENHPEKDTASDIRNASDYGDIKEMQASEQQRQICQQGMKNTGETDE